MPLLSLDVTGTQIPPDTIQPIVRQPFYILYQKGLVWSIFWALWLRVHPCGNQVNCHGCVAISVVTDKKRNYVCVARKERKYEMVSAWTEWSAGFIILSFCFGYISGLTLNNWKNSCKLYIWKKKIFCCIYFDDLWHIWMLCFVFTLFYWKHFLSCPHRQPNCQNKL